MREIVGDDSWLFGWDATPGIVSVWADRRGQAVLWQRIAGTLRCVRERYRPWVYATSLADLEHLGTNLRPDEHPHAQRGISYRELDGEPGSFRWLISANDGRLLERTIAAGAARRLGRAVEWIGALSDDYYVVGPVEQYLMQTGRVLFRDLAYSDLVRLQFDLETTSLSPKRGWIFMVAIRDSRGFEHVLEAPTESDEPALIHDLCEIIRERDPDVIENHNLFGFDLPFLYERALFWGVPLALGRPEAPRFLERFEEPGSSLRRRRMRYTVAGRELIDTLDAVVRHDFSARDMPGHGLKAAARYFGVAAPERTYVAGAEVYATYQRDPDMVRRYALDDVREVDGLSRNLMGAAFALAAMAPRRYERLASAGPAMGVLEPMLVRAYLRSGMALPRMQGGTEEGNHAGGATWLLAEGLAQQVVKVDIASMYPSLMRIFRIGPRCDRLDALLFLVDRLTSLRLQHKQAARDAQDRDLAQWHKAVQSAMKILINSAYGYMGAGHMALFADRAAADEVTRRGRETLQQVVDALRVRGMALLEADTDGVFFAAPLGWSEQQEQALVAEVAAELPEGLRLEYEGRYRAMLCHEVKNYALLGYDESVIVRGVALRSSRSEPFGELFLKQALAALLRGDVLGVRQIFEQTVRDLRERRISVEDVAAYARLSKSPAQYRESRARLREAVYEAMLAAGHTEWQAGEKVRFYRGQNGQAVWLPDAGGAATASDTGSIALGDVSNAAEAPREAQTYRNDYDIEHYTQVLLTSYAGRLRKAFRPEDFDQLFRIDLQLGLFDQPLDQIKPLWIECAGPA